MTIELPFVLAGALTGFVVGLTGVGGGALMTPILLLVFGIAPATAVATDLWFAAITKLAAVAIHHRAGNVDWQVARRLWLGSLPVAVAVVALVAFGLTVKRLGWLTQIIKDFGKRETSNRHSSEGWNPVHTLIEKLDWTGSQPSLGRQCQLGCTCSMRALKFSPPTKQPH
jgi:hypothetical protein